MKKVYMLSGLVFLFGCAKESKMTIVNPPTITQNCTVSQVEDSAVITCPDGTTLTLPPTVVIQTETVEIPVIVEVPSECHHGHGNHNGHDNHDD